MLPHCLIVFRSSFSSFTNKNGKDPRFKAVEKMRDREDYFKDYVDELYKKEKEEKRKEKDKVYFLIFNYSLMNYSLSIAKIILIFLNKVLPTEFF